ncbi:hypothetical protein AURDEDRAFT_175304 [Auricularia subglabra TFB-10046 SS5]|uniref:Uncharacterized protein n=1 Tax=Auricularia subglabra (strain TFB-10046 / SS5) TaxID=717982 RepID=J0CXT7_AURST|nr:hypothetical protein AURDEDRAFT_175304 [Auricularia subglabra TFB-10046 SS5]
MPLLSRPVQDALETTLLGTVYPVLASTCGYDPGRSRRPPGSPLAFASRFGPSLRTRAAALSGAECVIQLPWYTPTGGDVGAQVLTVPAEYCVQRRPITTRGIPRLTRGHDVSGGIFLLSLSILTLVDDVATDAPFDALASRVQLTGGVATAALVALWHWMLLMTRVYFHLPLEKISGLVVGITAYLFTKIPMHTLTAPSRAKMLHQPSGMLATSTPCWKRVLAARNIPLRAATRARSDGPKD